MGKRPLPPENRTFLSQITAPSARNSSSASNHDSSGQNNNAQSSSTSTSSDESGSNCDSNGTSQSSLHQFNGELNDSASLDLLTEDAVRQHNAEYEPMNSRERIKFWRISEEFSEIEDDFDELRNFSKPIRSERVSRMGKDHI